MAKTIRTPGFPPDAPELRPIPSTCGFYLAGSDGNIWRAPGFDANGAWVSAHMMRPKWAGGHGDKGGRRQRDRGRYLAVTLSVGGVRTEAAVHRLVAEAWLPDFHRLLVVHHVNRDPTDNRPKNLRCMLRTEHERLHGIQVTDADVTLERCLFEEERGKPEPGRMWTRPAPTPTGAERKMRSVAHRLGLLINECEEIKEKEDGRE